MEKYGIRVADGPAAKYWFEEYGAVPAAMTQDVLRQSVVWYFWWD